MNNISTLFLYLIGVLIISGSASAGDVASLDFIGFAENGDAYYIEYGRQDGSGFTYAVLARSSATGGDVLEQVTIKDESADIETARLKVLSAVSEVLPPNDSLKNGLLVFARTHTDVSSTDGAFSFYLNNYYSESDIPVRATVTVTEKPAGDDCYGFFEVERALSASLLVNSSIDIPITDTLKPEGCIRNFRLGRVYTTEIKEKRQLAIFFMVDKLGFEGNDVRWMGVTVSIDVNP